MRAYAAGMVIGSRAEKLIQAYDQERQDERAYWWTTSTLMLTALAAVLALVSAPISEKAWGIWAATPLFATMVLSYHVHQSAVGARRRIYMEAIERELSEGEAEMKIDTGIAASSIRPLAYNRYSWSLASNQKRDAPELIARVFFQMMTAIPLILLVAVEVTSVWRLSNSHSVWAIAVGALSFLATLFLIYALLVLTGARSRQRSWRKANPTP